MSVNINKEPIAPVDNFYIVGINGEADMGKDTVADWLCAKYGLTKASFADPMKRFAKQVFGFSEKQLWGPSSLRNADDLREAEEIWLPALAKFQYSALNLINEVVPDGLRVAGYNKLLEWFTHSRKAGYRSPRAILQTLGTEWGREVYPNMWVEHLYGAVVPQLRQGGYYTPLEGFKSTAPGIGRGVVIADHRFINEIDKTEAENGILVRIYRKSKMKTDNSNVGIQGHKSEHEQRGIPDERFNFVFKFDEGLEEMYTELEAVFAPHVKPSSRKFNLHLNENIAPPTDSVEAEVTKS